MYTFKEYVKLREEEEGARFRPGTPVKVLRTGAIQPEDGWIVQQWNPATRYYTVARAGVGTKQATEQQLLQWNHSQPAAAPKISAAERNRQFWAKVPEGTPRTPEFYIEKVKQFLQERGSHTDMIVQYTTDDWYMKRAKEIMALIKTFKGPLWRCISVQQPDNAFQEINWNKIGTSWAFEQSGAQCYKGAGGKSVYIQGYIEGENSIDVDTTILYYLIPHYQNEKEFRLKDGASVKLVDGYYLNDKYQQVPVQVNGTAKA
jgi:hypothetical protein